MDIPTIGDTIQIHSYKHNGRIHRIWSETTVLKGTKTLLIGANNRTTVTEADGRTWITREPAICYFHSRYWFNIIGMLRNDGIYYYCNLSSPFVIDGQALKYIDYDLDIKVFPDLSFTILDEDEYDEHRREMGYPDVINQILRMHMDILIQMIQQKKGPFDPGFIETWYEKYLMLKKDV